MGESTALQVNLITRLINGIDLDKEKKGETNPIDRDFILTDSVISAKTKRTILTAIAMAEIYDFSNKTLFYFIVEQLGIEKRPLAAPADAVVKSDA